MEINNSKIRFLEYRDFGKNLEISFAFFKQNFVPILKGIMFLIPLSIIAAFLIPSSQQELQTELLQMTSYSELYESLFGLFGLILLAILLHYIAIFIATLYVVCYIVEYQSIEGVEVDSSAVWARVRKHFMAILVSSILYTLLAVVGSFLCIIPGLVVAFLCRLYMYSTVDEDETITGCLNNSYQLVKQDWINAVVFLIIMLVINFVLSGVLSIPTFIASFSQGFSGEAFSSNVFTIIASIISYVGSLLLVPIMHIAGGAQYYSLRAKSEGYGYEDEISNLGRWGS